ncbi:MAG: aminofutalosine synthase MqnE [Acidobacteria bacterium]|nr:aminofutalosine synthase MqnE [Acidobacteriota bacterium]
MNPVDYWRQNHPELSDIAAKAAGGARLSTADARRLFECNDLPFIGYLANLARNRLNGDDAYFVVNRHLNYSNVCENRCLFCAFFRAPQAADAYVMTLPEIFAAVDQYQSAGVRELHIVGGLHPELPYEYYRDMLAGLRRRFPEIHLKAFTMVEIDHLSTLSGLGIRETLRDLKAAGLNSIPGGGAEIFSADVRQQLCPNKISGKRWLDIARIAHQEGIPSNATMLYGHLESIEHRVDHLDRLRVLQDETGGFLSFVPLAFHAAHTSVSVPFPTTGCDDLKTLAISRLFLDNVPHIKAYWIMLGPKIAQIALSFGADDLDGTIMEEKITHSAGARTAQAMTRDELVHLIRSAGRIPLERDALYNVVWRPEKTPVS